MAKFCTPTWLVRSLQEGPRRFLKYKAKGPPHSFTLTLYLEKRSWTDFYEKKRPTLNLSFSPITFHNLCKRLSSPLPTKSNSPLHFSSIEHKRHSRAVFLTSFERLFRSFCRCFLGKFPSLKLFILESSLRGYLICSIWRSFDW